MAAELDAARKDSREANQQLMAAESSIGLAKARVEAAEKGFATVDAERAYLEKEMQTLAKARAEVDARRGVARAKIGASSWSCRHPPPTSLRPLGWPC